MQRFTRRTILGCFAAAGTLQARSNREVLESVKQMETRDQLTIFTGDDVARKLWLGYSPKGSDTIVALATISPDGQTICWSEFRFFKGLPEFTLWLSDVNTGFREVPLGDSVSGVFSIASGQRLIVIQAFSQLEQRKVLYGVRLKTGVIFSDLTPAIRDFDVNSVEYVGVSGEGTRAAIGSRDEIAVLDVADGKTIYQDFAWFPRLSPDGNRLAYIKRERLYIRLLEDGSTRAFLPHIRVMGAGGWSPDGRFLIAGAWTRLLAWEKRQIIVDTLSGNYCEIGSLGEGNWGTNLAWISRKLVVR